MRYAWLALDSYYQKLVSKDDQMIGTWAEFIAFMGTHEPQEDKFGAAAIVPYRADFGGADALPRSGLQKMPGARWNILSLDVDHEKEETLMPALAKLRASGVSFLVHTTWSYVEKFELRGEHRVRIHLALRDELTFGEVKAAKMRAAKWLGVDADPQTLGGHSLFFVPCAPASQIADAAVWSHDGTPLVLADLPELPEAEKAAVLEYAPIASHYREEWPEDVRDAAEHELERCAYLIEHNKRDHLRDLLKSNVSWVGGYIGAGLIKLDDALERLETACYVRAEANTEDDKSAEERADQVEEFIEYGINRPCVPRGFDPDDGEVVEVDKLRGMGRLKYQLLAQVPERMFTVPQAAQEMAMFLRQPRNGRQGFVGLIEVSVGTGKTYQLRQLAEERARRCEYTVIVSLDHALLGQIRRDLEAAGTPARHIASVMQPESKTGQPQCARAEESEVQGLMAAGANVQASMCRKCPLASNCDALRASRRALTEYVVLAPYDMAERALDMIDERKDSPGAPLLVCDEEPPAPERVSIDRADLEKLHTDHPVWDLLRNDQAQLLIGLRQLMLDDNDGAAGEHLEAIEAFYGQLHAPKLSKYLAGAYRKQLDILKKLMAMSTGWAGLEHIHKIETIDDETYETDEYTTKVPGRVWRTLATEGGFVLSATPNPKSYVEAGIPVESITLRVEDAPGTRASRTIIYTSHGSRRAMLAGGVVDWDLFKADLHQLFEIVDPIVPGARYLIGTYKAISDRLRTDMKHLLQERDIEVTHYEVVRGRDDWRERDVFVSLYDPRTPADTFEESSDSAVRTLEQFHGRSRDPQPRERGAIHVHFGTLAPLSWHQSGNVTTTEVRRRNAGRPPNPLPTDQRQFVQAYIASCGGRVEAARLAGVSRATLSRYEGVKLGMSAGFQGIVADRLAR